MAVGDENVAIRGDQHVRGSVEGVIPGARNARLTQPHQQLTLGAELQYLVSLALFALCISNPDVVLVVDKNTVGPDKKSGAETSLQATLSVEHQNGVDIVFSDTAVFTTALGDPDIIVTVDKHGAGRAPASTLGQFTPVLESLVWVFYGYGWYPCCQHNSKNDTPEPVFFG